MKAIVQNRYGSADVLELNDIPQPEIGDEEVLVRVHAAGLDPGVWHLMTGLPYLVRLMGSGPRTPKSRVCGMDLAGRVEAIGKKVTRFEVGQDVFGACNGSFAEYACAKEKNLARKPANVSHEQAAAVAVSGLTALQGIRDKGEVAAGSKVLVTGAAGGVGTFAVQIAKALGAKVTGICSTAKVDLVRSIGADHVLDSARYDIAPEGQRYDAILDTAGNRPLSRLRSALTDRGALVMVGGEGGGRWLGGTDRQLRALLLSPFVRHKLRPFIAAIRKDDLQILKNLIEIGKVTPVIDRTFSLNDVPEAMRYLESRQARGKIVIKVIP